MAIAVALSTGFASCSDDEDIFVAQEAAESKDEIECEVVDDTEIHELLSMLEASHAIYVTETTLTEEDANATNDVHNVHYFGTGTDAVIDREIYRTAYKNGHYFICSERNIDELCEILDCEMPVDITEDPMHYDIEEQGVIVESSPVNIPENPENLTDEEWDKLEYEYDTTYVDVDIEKGHHECVYYMLFNENMQMVIALPVHEHVPQLTLETVLEAIYKYQDDVPEHRSMTSLPPSSPISFSWQEKYNFESDETGNNYSCVQRVTVSFVVNGCYSFDNDADYYTVETTVTICNAQLKPFKSKVKNFKGWDDYYVYAGFSKGVEIKMMLDDDLPEILDKNQTVILPWDPKDPNKNVALIQSSPQTTIGSTSVTTGFSWEIGGEVGFIMTGKTPGGSASFNGGATFSESRTMSIPDVMVENYCVSDIDGKTDNQRLAVWAFEIADPYSHRHYMNTSNCRWAIEDVVPIGKTTATYMTSHLWEVKKPKETLSKEPKITAVIKSKCGISAGRCDWLRRCKTYKCVRYGDHAGVPLSFNLPQFNREK